MNKSLVLIVLGGIATSGCVTKSWGTMPALTAEQAASLSCPEIESGIAEVQAFRQTTAERAKVDVASVAAFAGDFGMGNAMARSAAEASAEKRMAALEAARTQKGCAAIIATATPAPAAAPQ